MSCALVREDEALPGQWKKASYYMNMRARTHTHTFFSGVGGSGRQSSTKLAAFMADYDLFQIEITKNYTTVEWREDIKKVHVHTICVT